MITKTKKFYIIGVSMIGASFICIVAAFYIMQQMNANNESAIVQLSEELTILEIEKTATESNLKDAQSKLNTIELDHLVSMSEKVYPEEEKRKKEGLLWIDKRTSLYVVTLGALNGLKPGSRLAVYDGGQRIGRVVVNTPMDVISYVSPVNNSLNNQRNDYYRVVIE